MSDKPNNETAFELIPDDAIDDEEKDDFGHSVFVDWLISALESSSVPINIGVFGRWGTGKTGILQVFEKKLNSKYAENYECCYVDCWRISPDHIRQQLLIEINNKLEGMNPDVLIEKLYHIAGEQNFVNESKGFVESIKELGKNAAAPIVFVGSILVGAFILDMYLPGNNILPIAGSTLLASFIIQLVIKLATTNNRIIRTVTKVVPPITSHKEFRDIFDEITAEYSNKKLVIALDNLDRCDSKVAIEILSLVKSFMEIPCVFFVIPCDTTAIAKHLKDNRKFDDDEVAEDFLRKFFQVTVTIPPLISSLMINYVDKLVEDYSIPNVDEDVKFVIVIASMDNPRRIKRFLNNYMANYQLAMRIEKEYLQDDVITSERGFLTKILVLQDKFPDFYKELVDEENLLEYVDNYLDDKDIPDHSKEEIGKLIKSDELKEFLKLTQDIKVDNIKPFIKLAQDPHEKSPRYTEIRRKMRTNNHKGINEIIRSNNNIDVFLKIIESTVDEDFKRRRFRFGKNDLNTILHAYDVSPDSHKNKFIELFGKHAISENILDNTIFDLEIVFEFIDKMQRVKSRNVILEKYCRIFFKPENYNDLLLGLLIGRSHFFTDTAKDSVKKHMAEFYSSQEHLAIPAIKKHFKDEHVAELFDNRIVEAIIDKMTEDISDHDQERIDTYLRIKQVANELSKFKFIEKLLRVIIALPDPMLLHDRINFVLGVLKNLDYNDVTKDGMSLIYDISTTREGLISNEDQRNRLLEFIIKHFDKLSEDDKTAFIDNKLQHIFNRSDDDLIRILSAMDLSKEMFLSHDKIFDAMFTVVSNNANPIVFEYLIKNTTGDQRDRVVNLIDLRIKSQDESKRRHIRNVIKKTHQNLQDVDKIVPSIIDASRNFNYPDRVEMWNLLTLIFVKCSLQTQDDIIQEFIKLMEDFTYHTTSKNCINVIWPHLTDAQKSNIWNEMIASINNRLDINTRPILDLLVDEEKITRDNYRSIADALTHWIGQEDKIILEYMIKIKKNIKIKEAIKLDKDIINKVAKIQVNDDTRELMKQFMSEDAGDDDQDYVQS